MHSFARKIIGLAFFAFLSATSAGELPTGPTVQQGSVAHSIADNTMTIDQTSARAVVNYDSFGIGAENAVNINMPDSNSAFLGRVTGPTISAIHGTLNSNGSVYLVNRNGIVVGETAAINVHKLVASTLDIADDEFMANPNNLHLTGNGGKIETYGTISAGVVALVAERIEHNGTINAAHVGLGAGHQGSLIIDEAAGGEIVLDFGHATVPGALIAGSGLIEGQTAGETAVTITIESANDVAMTGALRANGTIDLRSTADIYLGNIDGRGTVTANAIGDVTLNATDGAIVLGAIDIDGVLGVSAETATFTANMNAGTVDLSAVGSALIANYTTITVPSSDVTLNSVGGGAVDASAGGVTLTGEITGMKLVNLGTITLSADEPTYWGGGGTISGAVSITSDLSTVSQDFGGGFVMMSASGTNTASPAAGSSLLSSSVTTTAFANVVPTGPAVPFDPHFLRAMRHVYPTIISSGSDGERTLRTMVFDVEPAFRQLAARNLSPESLTPPVHALAELRQDTALSSPPSTSAANPSLASWTDRLGSELTIEY